MTVVPGYAGGTGTPTYEAVCTGTTGHIEVVEITYDPSVLSLQNLLTVFFATHDPTTPNRQGNDIGPQYQSAIFYSTPEQRSEAERYIAQLRSEQNNVVTLIRPLEQFFPAEDYHQNYYRSNPTKGYCQVVIAPKLHKVQAAFAELLRSDAVNHETGSDRTKRS